MFCSASEKLKAAAETPRSSVIGRMNRPKLWRMPMPSEMMSPLTTRRSSIERDFDMPQECIDPRFNPALGGAVSQNEEVLARVARRARSVELKPVRVDGVL